MLEHPEKDREIGYALWWLDSVAETAAEKPLDTLHHWTHVNYSGGRSGWEDEINQVYFKRLRLEESLLYHAIHHVLLVALARSVTKAQTKKNEGVWAKMHIAEVYRLGQMVSHTDPLAGLRAKIAANKLCQQLLGTSLHEEALQSFDCLTGEPGVSY